MRNDLPNISESAESIRKRIDSTTKKRLKQRLEALYLIKSGTCGTREAVSDALGVHRHTISRWLAKYEEGGIDEMLEIRTRPNRKRVIPAATYKALEQELRRAPEQFSSYRDIQRWLSRKHNLSVKYKTLYRLVKYELGVDVTSGSVAAEAAETRRKPSPAPTSRAISRPTVANFFRSVAQMLDDTSLQSGEVVQAVRAAQSLLAAAPPFGSLDREPRTYVSNVGRQINHKRQNARRRLRNLQSLYSREGISPEKTQDLLNRIADELDSIEAHDRIVETKQTVSATGLVDEREPESIFLDDEFDNPESLAELESAHQASDDVARNQSADYVVLFAEDDDLAVSLVKRQLTRQAASVIRARTETEVLEALAAHPVDLVILSTKLGSDDGIELLRKLRDEPAFDNIPIVAVGWTNHADDESEALRYGADAYVNKPFSPTEFSSTIVKLLIASRSSVQRSEDRGPIRLSGSPRMSKGRTVS